jgi:hypothetical protein
LGNTSHEGRYDIYSDRARPKLKNRGSADLETDEIALSPGTFAQRTDEEILSTLVHEMVHHWQRHFGKPGRGRYRRRMKQRLNKSYGRYGQRWQAETGFSMLKRRLATTVNGRSFWSQCSDLLLLAITFNIMLL